MNKSFSDAIDRLVIDYLNNMVSSVLTDAEASYIAGMMRGASMLGITISTDALQKSVAEYMRGYRYKLVDQGILTVTTPKMNDFGDIVGYVTEDIEWMKEKPAKIRNQLVDVIEAGIREGKPAGYKTLASGKYPAGTIAKDIQDVVSGYKSDAATIARTETARCYFEGERDRYIDSGVTYVQWMAAPDCCEMCEPYKGKIAKLSEFPHIPLHPNCRCDIRPILGSELDEYLKTNIGAL